MQVFASSHSAGTCKIFIRVLVQRIQTGSKFAGRRRDMGALHALSRSGREYHRGHPGRRREEKDDRLSKDDLPEDRLSKDGLPVTEEEYWEKYYNDPDFVYEWRNGYLEVRPVSDQKGSETCQWFCDILRCYVRTHQAGRISTLDIGFRMALPGGTSIRRPDVAVVLGGNPVAINDDDCTYQGIFDLCVESLSHSAKREVERDTVYKKKEYRGAGVREYYILDARGTETAFYSLGAGGQYRKIRLTGGIIISGILPGFRFRVSDLYRKPSLEELAEDPVYYDYVFPSFKDVRKELALEKKRAEKESRRAEKEKKQAEKERRRAEKAEKSLASEKRRAEREKAFEIARTMFANGLEAAVVMKCAGLSPGEVAALEREA